MTARIVEPSPTSTDNLMQKLVRWLIKPSNAIPTLEGKRQAQLISGLTLTLCILVGIRIVIGLRSGSYREDSSFILFFILVGAQFVSYLLSRTKYITAATLIFVLALSGLVYGVIIVRNSPDSLANFNTLLWLLPSFIFGALLFPFWVGLFWMAGNFVALFLLPRLYPSLESSSLRSLMFTVFVLMVLNLVLNRYRQQVENDRQAFALATNRELQSLNTALEERVAERTKALQTSAEVSRRLSTILDPNQLVLEVVQQVQAAFNYYHAHIYLLDESKQILKMVGGTGDAGKEMLAKGHTIHIERGLVGRAARTQLPVFAPDTASEPGWLPNPLLMETKAEIAVPMIVGDQVLGVLDVQQHEINGLTETDVELLQSIANQTAIALQNAVTLQTSRENEETIRQSQELFRTILETSPVPLIISSIVDGKVLYANEQLGQLLKLSVAELLGRQTPDFYFNPADRTTLLSKVRQEGKVRDYELHVKKSDGTPFWVSASLQLITYANAPALLAAFYDLTARKSAEENLAKRAERDRVLARIATRIRGAVSMEEVLQVATQEVRQATKATRSVVTIEPNEDTMTLQPVTVSDL